MSLKFWVVFQWSLELFLRVMVTQVLNCYDINYLVKKINIKSYAVALSVYDYGPKIWRKLKLHCIFPCERV